MTNTEKLVALATIRQVELQRLATWAAGLASIDLDELRKEMMAAVMEADVTGAARADHRRSRLTKLLEELDDQITEAFAKIEKRAVELVDELQDVQTDDEKKNRELLFGLLFTGEPEVTARKTLISGTTVPETVRGIRDDLAYKVAALVRQSSTNLEPATVTAAKVGGSAAPSESQAARGISAPVTRPAESAVSKAIRTAVGAVGNQAAVAVKPPTDIPPMHWVHVSILDSRTSQPCRARAYKRWDQEKNPIGHSLRFQEPPIFPPEHPCRSRLVLYFEDDGPPAQRTFKQWMANVLTPEQQDRVFGARAMALWRKGQLNDGQLIRQESRPLSIDALRKITDEKGSKQKEFPFL